jgi:predicted AAA+ superfamily ATPase
MLVLYRDPLFTCADRVAEAARLAPVLPPVTGNAWRDAVIDRVVHADNPWSRDAERRGEAACQGWLADLARSDLRRLQALAEDLPGGVGAPWGEGPVAEAARALAAARDWGACLPALARHHAAHGCGDFARYGAFRWAEGRLWPVEHPDPGGVIIGYAEQRRALAANVERFLRGLPAHDVLLYGDRGTGKSSCVKALLPAYRAVGLRLIEADREVFRDWPALLATVRGRRQRFLLFLDDLSFEAAETGYKALKAALQGGLEARPDNLLVVATSNRRHLVHEDLDDRSDPYAEDSIEEKVSLADRFGLTLVFPAPDQDAYLTIVAGLCRERGLAIDAERLRERALRWALWGNGRSGRTARQLVDALVAEAALGQSEAAAGVDGS